MTEPEVYENDDVCIHLATDQYGDYNYLLEKVEDDKVVFRRWDRASKTHYDDSFPISILWNGDIRVLHFVSRFKWEYFGLAHAFFFVFTSIYKFRWWRSKRIEKSIRIQRNKIGLLRDLLGQYAYNPETLFTADDAMILIYGERINEAENNQRFWKYARLLIQSLVMSGDLVATTEPIEKSYEYRLSPQAISTLEQYDIEERRQKSQLLISTGQLFITLMLFLIALLTLLTGLGFFDTSIDSRANNSVDRSIKA